MLWSIDDRLGETPGENRSPRDWVLVSCAHGHSKHADGAAMWVEGWAYLTEHKGIIVNCLDLFTFITVTQELLKISSPKLSVISEKIFNVVIYLWLGAAIFGPLFLLEEFIIHLDDIRGEFSIPENSLSLYILTPLAIISSFVAAVLLMVIIFKVTRFNKYAGGIRLGPKDLFRVGVGTFFISRFLSVVA
jgi:hypothetical protein